MILIRYVTRTSKLTCEPYNITYNLGVPLCKIQSLEPQKVRSLSFSDAAFATQEKAHSQKGCLILATTEEINETRSAPVSPLLWFSKKTNRVVSSMLASETFALSGALDLLSWTRLHWSWMLDPSWHCCGRSSLGAHRI